MDDPKTFSEVVQYFSDPGRCHAFIAAVRWPDGVVRCPHCNSQDVAWREKSQLYFCAVAHPRRKFSIRVGTIFENSPIALEKWLSAAWLIANHKGGISSHELSRAVGVTQKSAWLMREKLRGAMSPFRPHPSQQTEK